MHFSQSSFLVTTRSRTGLNAVFLANVTEIDKAGEDGAPLHLWIQAWHADIGDTSHLLMQRQKSSIRLDPSGAESISKVRAAAHVQYYKFVVDNRPDKIANIDVNVALDIY